MDYMNLWISETVSSGVKIKTWMNYTVCIVFSHFKGMSMLKQGKNWKYDQLIFQFNIWQVISYETCKVYGVQNISRTSRDNVLKCKSKVMTVNWEKTFLKT